MASYFMIKPDGLSKDVTPAALSNFIYSFANYLSGQQQFLINEAWHFTAEQATIHSYERSLSEKEFQGQLRITEESLLKIQTIRFKNKYDFVEAIEVSFGLLGIEIIKVKDIKLNMDDISGLYGNVDKNIFERLIEYLNEQHVRMYALKCESNLLQHMKTFIRHFFGESNHGYQLKNLVHVFDASDIAYAIKIFEED